MHYESSDGRPHVTGVIPAADLGIIRIVFLKKLV
jgi:hypothetical protein